MKKNEMIKEMIDAGIDVSNEKWNVIQKRYKSFKEASEFSTLKDASVEYNVDYMIEELRKGGWNIPSILDYYNIKILWDNMNYLRTAVDPVEMRERRLEMKRSILKPQIKDLIGRLRGRSNASTGEIKEIIKLYNQYYMRRENASCGSCVAKCYDALKRIIKV